MIGLSDRVVVMAQGEVTGVVSGEDITEDKIMYHAVATPKGAAGQRAEKQA